jgi:hypothetical protein
MILLNFFKLPNLSSLATALGFTQPLTEISTRKTLWAQSVVTRKADNLTAICAPIV